MRSKVKVIKKPKDAIKALKKIAATMSGDESLKVGLPLGSNPYPDGTSVIMVGIVHEFGSAKQGIPQRSFLRSTMHENRRKYKRMFRKLAGKIIDGKLDNKQALNLLGEQVKGDVVGKISSGIEPGLKSREGTPLFDTGHLAESIIYKVED